MSMRYGADSSSGYRNLTAASSSRLARPTSNECNEKSWLRAGPASLGPRSSTRQSDPSPGYPRPPTPSRLLYRTPSAACSQVKDHGPAPEVIVPELVRFLRSAAWPNRCQLMCQSEVSLLGRSSSPGFLVRTTGRGWACGTMLDHSVCPGVGQISRRSSRWSTCRTAAFCALVAARQSRGDQDACTSGLRRVRRSARALSTSKVSVPATAMADKFSIS
jgi:hypothetical protein